MDVGAYLTETLSAKGILNELSEICSYELYGRQDSFDLLYLGDSRVVNENALLFGNDKYLRLKYHNCLILVEAVPQDIDENNIYCVVDDPKSVFIDYVNGFLFEKTTPFKFEPKISGDAVIAESAQIAPDVYIGANTKIMENAVIHSGAYIGANCIIGEGVCIGNEGIARYKNNKGEVKRFPHLAGVFIGDNVEIGANTVIPKGMLSPTEIANNVVLGNLCNIGHGVKLAENVWASVGTLIGGHTRVGANTSIGMGVRIKDNLSVGSGVSIGMGSVVIKNVTDNISVFGNPAKKVGPIKAGPVR